MFYFLTNKKKFFDIFFDEEEEFLQEEINAARLQNQKILTRLIHRNETGNTILEKNWAIHYLKTNRQYNISVMERSRDYLPVRIGTWSKKNFLVFCVLVLACLVTTMFLGIVQSQTLPYFISKEPSGGSGTDLDMLNANCKVDVFGDEINDKYCYAHYFKINDFFTQYFTVDAYFQ